MNCFVLSFSRSTTAAPVHASSYRPPPPPQPSPSPSPSLGYSAAASFNRAPASLFTTLKPTHPTPKYAVTTAAPPLYSNPVSKPTIPPQAYNSYHRTTTPRPSPSYSPSYFSPSPR